MRARDIGVRISRHEPIRVAVLGSGYVGLTTAACLAHLGHRVHCTDVIADRVAGLQRGVVPILEEDLPDLVSAGLASGLLTFGTDNVQAVTDAEVVFLCVPTPQGSDGRADLSFVEAAASQIGPHLPSGAIVVNKSTVPVGTTAVVVAALGRVDVAVASNPEFLREGTAVFDFLHPDRIVIGANDERVAARLAALYVHLTARIVITDTASAEVVKYASNAFLATKISFINAIAALCESVDADVREVARGMGLDSRIGAEFLRPGPGWGGSCFPKDTSALVRIAEDNGYDFRLLKEVMATNDDQFDRVVHKAERLAGGSLQDASVAIWGLTFKAGTDDLRQSPALEVARRFRVAGATVRAYDPTVTTPHHELVICPDAYAACAGASVLVLCTDWPEFRSVDLERVGALMDRRAVLDGRNVLDAVDLRRAGFEYDGIGVRGLAALDREAAVEDEEILALAGGVA